MRAPPESLKPTTGAPMRIARSITLQIFLAYAAESEPPNTVKSCAKTTTLRPSTRPQPVTTPSPSTFCLSISKSVQSWTTKRSTSTNVPGSRNRSSRSRAVSLPASCCFWIRAAPPPASERRFISSRRAFAAEPRLEPRMLEAALAELEDRSSAMAPPVARRRGRRDQVTVTPRRLFPAPAEPRRRARAGYRNRLGSGIDFKMSRALSLLKGRLSEYMVAECITKIRKPEGVGRRRLHRPGRPIYGGTFGIGRTRTGACSQPGGRNEIPCWCGGRGTRVRRNARFSLLRQPRRRSSRPNTSVQRRP